MDENDISLAVDEFARIWPHSPREFHEYNVRALMEKPFSMNLQDFYTIVENIERPYTS